MNSLRPIRNVFLVSILLILAACGGGDSRFRAVEYLNTTLIVHGTRYERQAERTDTYVPNDVIVNVKPGRLADGHALMKELGLTVDTTMQALEVLVIKVPAGFENQWATALMRFDVVHNATRNIIIPLPDPTPVIDIRLAVEYEGTTLIVHGTRYERQPPPGDGLTYSPKDIIVGFRAGRMAEGEQLMKSLDLPVHSAMNALEVVVVTVPEGFEAQWARALISFDAVRAASRNALITLPGLAPVTDGQVGPSSGV